MIYIYLCAIALCQMKECLCLRGEAVFGQMDIYISNIQIFKYSNDLYVYLCPIALCQMKECLCLRGEAVFGQMDIYISNIQMIYMYTCVPSRCARCRSVSA
jgi:hypothetical protein